MKDQERELWDAYETAREDAQDRNLPVTPELCRAFRELVAHIGPQEHSLNALCRRERVG